MNNFNSKKQVLMKNEMIFKVVKFVTAALLLLAIASIPIGYYTFLRIVVCIASVYMAIAYFENKKPLAIIFGAIAILFNPILPIYLSKEIWIPIDVITAIIFVVSIFFRLRKTKEMRFCDYHGYLLNKLINYLC